MIKAECGKGEEKGQVIIEGETNELMNEFRVICKGMRRVFAKNFGEEYGNKMFDAISSDKPDDEVEKEVRDIWNAFVKEKADEIKSKSGDLIEMLLKSMFGERDED
nr:hypothetical protein [uncultured Mediterraneibacter sp.]